MHIPPERRAWLKAEALRRLTKKPLTEQQRFLLAECLQAYLELATGAEQEEFERLLAGEAFKEVKTMGTTWFEQGLRQGQAEGLCRATLRILQARFGELNQAVRERVEHWPADKLEELISRAVLVQSLAELSL